MVDWPVYPNAITLEATGRNIAAKIARKTQIPLMKPQITAQPLAATK
jgi:hypothetical protein